MNDEYPVDAELLEKDFLEKTRAHTEMQKQQFQLELDFFKKYSRALDKDGYPTRDGLNLIEKWHWQDPLGWMSFIKNMWYYSSWGWHQDNDVPHEYRKGVKVNCYDISTAGWSGNEAIIRAMQKNEWLWNTIWVASRRGGHYTFEVIINEPGT